MVARTKNILLHVGTRDLQNNGIQNYEFAKLFAVCNQTWKDANIYMSLIMRRRDKPYDIILDENKQIRQVLEKFPNIRIIEQFEPPDRMFHDDVHLNNYGISAIVNHLKIALNLSPPFMSKRRKSGQGRRSDMPQREDTFRPQSAPLSVQPSPYNLNTHQESVRPLSNPPFTDNFQFHTQNANAFQNANMLPPVAPWIPHQNQANLFMQMRNPWGWPMCPS